MSQRTFDENREAGKAMAEMSAEATGILVAFIAHNAESAARLNAQIRWWVEDERDEWRERALRAEAELEAVRHRVSGLLYPTSDEVELWVKR